MKGSCNHNKISGERTVKRAPAARPRFCSFLSSSLPDPHTINTSVPPSESLTLSPGANRHTSCLLFVSSQHQETRFYSSPHPLGPAPSSLIDESYLTWTLFQPQLQQHSISVPSPPSLIISVASAWWHWHPFCPLCLILFELVYRNGIASVWFRFVSRIIIGSVRRLTTPFQPGGYP